MPKKSPTYIKTSHGGFRKSRGNPGYDASYWSKTRGRLRKRLPDQLSAMQWLVEQEALEPVRRKVPPNVVEDAVAAASLLPEGVSLLDVVRSYLSGQIAAAPAIGTSRKLSDVISEYLTSRASAIGRLTLDAYKVKLLNLDRSLHSPSLGAITAQKLEDFLKPLTPYSHNAMLRALSAFFKWCVKRNYISTDPSDPLELVKTAEPPRGVITPDEAQRLLNACTDCETGLYLSIGMFAGLRPEETFRISDKAFTNPDYIMLDGSITKTARTRTVPISDNLKAWIAHFGGIPTGKLITYSAAIIRRKIAKLAKSLSIEIPSDGLRHSFATYRFDLTRNAPATASEMGHAGTDIFFRHYRALCQPGDGQKFFAIMPPNSPKNTP